MKKFLAIGLLALVLAGCAQLKGALDVGTTLATTGIVNPINTQRLVTIKAGYGVALSAAVAYRRSCAQRLIPPSCRLIVPQIVQANRKVIVAVNRLESLRQLGPSIDLSEAVEQLSSAVNDFKVIVPAGAQ